ncbi:MAG: c-type cytochrome [Bacteroidales bacterium]|nr:c-type cytochrome [Bacteroidales bacterium]MCF8387074.1 c-type cytochrome [Bacteroidales bacterium]MCF8397746.1 c-type cytochrome [Bacteroidales bacterium]
MKKSSITLIAGFAFLMMSFGLPEGDKTPWEIPDEYKNMENPYKGDKGLDRIGKMLYAKNCKSCHGNKGEADGPRAKQIDVPMFDLSSEDFQAAYNDGEIYYMSIIGRDEMPNFESKIPDDEDRWAVVNYIRSLKK